MGLVNFLDPNQLVNASQLPLPQLQTMANLVNNLYVIVGGIVGLSLIFILLRWREAYLFRRRMEEVEEGLILINEKLDCLLKKKKKK
ncbi:MAG: hypothetical protein V1702_06165 [Candidatus Woesearchaeota archaeon]